jgi:hypothetical protein
MQDVIFTLFPYKINIHIASFAGRISIGIIQDE